MSTSPATRTRRRLIAPVALMAVAAAGLSIVASGAWFTGSTSVGSNTFSTGTVTLATNPTTTLFNVSNMAPGDVVYKEITVNNTGSLALRYSLTQSVGTDAGGLATQLDREVKTGAATCDASGYAAATNVASASSKVSTAAVFGNPDSAQTGTVGATGADRVLAAGGSEKLCFKVSLPTATGDAYQGKTLSGSTLTFDAVQTQNN